MIVNVVTMTVDNFRMTVMLGDVVGRERQTVAMSMFVTELGHRSRDESSET